jgi:hypothetical protein
MAMLQLAAGERMAVSGALPESWDVAADELDR